MVDDDDGDGFPSPEPRTDSRSALPREIRAWRWLRIVKRNESFSLTFFPPECEYMESRLRSVEHHGAHKAGGTQGGRARPHPRGQPGTLLAQLFYSGGLFWSIKNRQKLARPF